MCGPFVVVGSLITSNISAKIVEKYGVKMIPIGLVWHSHPQPKVPLGVPGVPGISPLKKLLSFLGPPQGGPGVKI